MPIYAECGGLMYLVEAIQDAAGARYAMVGLLPGICRLTDRLQNFGYKEVVSLTDSLLGKAGLRTRGHEFHYSSGKGGRGIAACTRPSPVVEMKVLRGIVSRTSQRHTCICTSMPARRCPNRWSNTPQLFVVSGKRSSSPREVGDVGLRHLGATSWINRVCAAAIRQDRVPQLGRKRQRWRSCRESWSMKWRSHCRVGNESGSVALLSTPLRDGGRVLDHQGCRRRPRCDPRRRDFYPRRP